MKIWISRDYGENEVLCLWSAEPQATGRKPIYERPKNKNEDAVWRGCVTRRIFPALPEGECIEAQVSIVGAKKRGPKR